MIYHPLYFKKKAISVVALIIITGPENTNITGVLIRKITNRKTSHLQDLPNLYLWDKFYTYHSNVLLWFLVSVLKTESSYSLNNQRKGTSSQDLCLEEQYLGQCLILLEASEELMQWWLSHLFTGRRRLSLRWRPLRETWRKTIQATVNRQLFSQLRISHLPWPTFQVSSSLCCTKCSRENRYRTWLSACFLLKLDDSFSMSGAQICIQHMKITSMSSLFNLQHPENITCSFYFYNTLAQRAYWLTGSSHSLAFYFKPVTWRMFSSYIIKP